VYILSQQQISYISDDIRHKGIGMDSLHDDLLDHVCCLLEERLTDDTDFEKKYHEIIRTFYREHLWEIEEETYLLITLKNYHTMKKITIISGLLSALILATGILFKFMFWPGAIFFIFLGITLSSLIFLPLLLVTKVKHAESTRDKIVTSTGLIIAIIISMHILFKVFYWPGANLLFHTGAALFLLTFIPAFFYAGYKRPENRNSTIITTLLMVLGCGLFFTIIRSPKAAKIKDANATRIFLQSEKLLQRKLAFMEAKKTYGGLKPVNGKIFETCEKLKTFILNKEVGATSINDDFELKGQIIGDNNVGQYFDNAPEYDIICSLGNTIDLYNAEHREDASFNSQQVKELFRMERSVAVLGLLNQIQMQMLEDREKGMEN
jgi:hypothetical protein